MHWVIQILSFILTQEYSSLSTVRVEALTVHCLLKIPFWWLENLAVPFSSFIVGSLVSAEYAFVILERSLKCIKYQSNYLAILSSAGGILFDIYCGNFGHFYNCYLWNRVVKWSEFGKIHAAIILQYKLQAKWSSITKLIRCGLIICLISSYYIREIKSKLRLSNARLKVMLAFLYLILMYWW